MSYMYIYCCYSCRGAPVPVGAPQRSPHQSRTAPSAHREFGAVQRPGAIYTAGHPVLTRARIWSRTALRPAGRPSARRIWSRTAPGAIDIRRGAQRSPEREFGAVQRLWGAPALQQREFGAVQRPGAIYIYILAGRAPQVYRYKAPMQDCTAVQQFSTYMVQLQNQ
jgi:hypothetical protein